MRERRRSGARRGARRRARRHDAKNAALTHAARALRRDAQRTARRECARRRRRARAPAHDAAFVDRLTLTPQRIDAMARGLERDRRAARPGRRNSRPPLSAVRHPGRHDARAARRHRHHLRIAAERDRRCRGPVPQVGQRDDPARRLRGDPQQPRDRRMRARGPARARACPSTRCSSSTPPIARPSAT